MVILAALLCVSLFACDDATSGDQAITKITIKLVQSDSEDALVDADALNEGETEYYVVTGYTFSDEDAAIVARGADYYSDFYNGPRKDTDAYKNEKQRFEELGKLILPTAVKVKVSESSIELTAEDLATVNAGVIDLSDGDAEATVVNIRAIEDSALLNHSELKSVVVPEGYLAIGAGAFSGCGALEEITLPFVGQKAGALNAAKTFGYIFGTVEYTGGVSVTQSYNASGSATYYVPESLKNVVVKGELPMYAFHNITKVETVTFEAEETIAKSAFNGCAGLKSVIIPATVKTIGESAFNGCASLASVNFAALTVLETIENSAFANCKALFAETKAIALPASVSFIGEQAFAGCTSVETLSVESATVKAGAFSGLTSLKTANLLNCTLSVGSFATWGDMLTVTCTGCTIASDSAANVILAFMGAFESDLGAQKANIVLTIA